MANDYYDNTTNIIIAATTAEAADVENKCDDIAAGFELVETDMDNTIQLTNADNTNRVIADAAGVRASKMLGCDSTGEFGLQVRRGTFKGDWAATTFFYQDDLVHDAADTLGEGLDAVFVCQVNHTSSALLSTDSANWSLMLSTGDINDAIALKADTTYVDTADDLKADLTYVDALDTTDLNFTASGTGAQARTSASKHSDIVSVADFGIVPGADYTTEMALAIAAHDELFFPPGNYLFGPLVFGSSFKALYGNNATITASGTIATDVSLLTFSGCTDLIVRDIEIDVDHTTYPTVVSLIASSCTNTLISNIHCSDTGKTGINLTNCVNSTIEKCTVTDWQHIGIIATGASSQDNVIKNNKVNSATGATHAIQCTLGANETVINNYVEEAGVFGISLYKTSRSKAINNTVINTTKEAINAQEAPYNEIRGNNCYWSAAQSEDFGISIFTPTGDPLTTSGVIVSDNNIQNAGKSGIGVAEDVEYSLISNNIITNCNLLSGAEEHGGICLYGVGCVGNVVSNNLILDTGGNHDYGVFEWTNAGTPSLSHIHNNDITGFTGSEVKIIAADSKTDVWIDFNPTITAATGTITTIATYAGFYRVVNKSCEVYLSIDITTNGTGAGYVNATLPYTIRTGISHFNLSGREDGISGDLLNGDVVAQAVRIRTYDNQYPGVDGASIVMSGSYAI